MCMVILKRLIIFLLAIPGFKSKSGLCKEPEVLRDLKIDKELVSKLLIGVILKRKIFRGTERLSTRYEYEKALQF